MRRLLNEPLLHFVLLALAIFSADHFLNPKPGADGDRIIVTQARTEQLAGLFEKTWQRRPTPVELKGLVNSYIKEEIYYREAVALGLDKNDTVIRRRMRLKMEFLSLAESELRNPTDAELKEFLDANSHKYAIRPRISFSQIYFDTNRRGEKLDQKLKEAMEILHDHPESDPAALGDASLLPPVGRHWRQEEVAQTFGIRFADAIIVAPVGHWSGPIASSFGTHLVLVSEREPSRLANLNEVRRAVQRDWQQEQRKAYEDQRFSELRKKYDVVFEKEGGLQAAEGH